MGERSVYINLPMPVSTNALYRNVPGKGRAKTKRYLSWLNAAGWDIKEQKPRKLHGRYNITLLIERKDNRRRDIGNLHKGVSDLLVAHQIIQDDSLEERVVLQWSDTVKGCLVILEPVEVRQREAA